MLIKEVRARKIKDSRNEPTIEVSVNGCKASSPAGKSTGKYETPSYHKSLSWNISAINNLKELREIEINKFSDLIKVERLIKRKFKLKDATQFGANALFALESAILKALAKSKKKALWQVVNDKARKIPIPLGNAIGGGLHSHNKNHPTFQEFLLIPQGKTAVENFSIIKKVHAQLKKQIKSTSMNDEGAWQTSLPEEDVLDVLSRQKKVKIGLDVAASSFYCDRNYCYGNKCLNKTAQIYFINELIKVYNLAYVEDPLDEKDFAGFANISKKALICGDDLTATHLSRLRKAARMRAITAMIVKPNQNGSLLELKKICDFCKKHRIKIVISHRSGETLDSALADYAVAFNADLIKCGIATKWRETKLKRLIEIEKELHK
jgi:enolase